MRDPRGLQSVRESGSLQSLPHKVYAAWFLLELMLRIRNDGWNFIFTPDWSWNLLDVFVVLTSLWDSWK